MHSQMGCQGQAAACPGPPVISLVQAEAPAPPLGRAQASGLLAPWKQIPEPGAGMVFLDHMCPLYRPPAFHNLHLAEARIRPTASACCLLCLHLVGAFWQHGTFI